MSFSRQEEPLTNDGRAKQKSRTRTALLQAATELLREGKAPSMPEAAERALISLATAYRYFSSAEDLWWEASTAAVGSGAAVADAVKRIEAAGDDPFARLEACLRATGFSMLEDQAPYRRLAKAALDQWFRQTDVPESERTPVREGRRNRHIAAVVAPLRKKLPKKDVDRLARALGVVVGTDAMLALTDGVGLEVAQAKQAMLDAGRWMLQGALGEIKRRP